MHEAKRPCLSLFLLVVPSGRVCQTLANQEGKGGNPRKEWEKMPSPPTLLLLPLLPPLVLMGDAKETREEEKGPLGQREKRVEKASFLAFIHLTLNPLSPGNPPSFLPLFSLHFTDPLGPSRHPRPFLRPFFLPLSELEEKGERRFLGSQHFHYYRYTLGSGRREGRKRSGRSLFNRASITAITGGETKTPSCFFSRHRLVVSSCFVVAAQPFIRRLDEPWIKCEEKGEETTTHQDRQGFTRHRTPPNFHRGEEISYL